ncbi:MAG TPA: FAD-binding oxidoreductase [Candidatus Krumholzibacteria bacterium]|nr:FAD-binding oxidoreductase [Candidatus Krumholzibacteria bacterium]
MSTNSAIHRDGQAIDIDPKHVDALRASLRGTLVTGGDAAYNDARSIWNAMIDRKPALIARCVGVSDIVAGVKFARETGIALSIKGGGHNIAGTAVADGGLMMDLSNMRGVWVDSKARVAHAQPGALLGDIDRETQLHGQAAVLGFVSATGATGLTLGGGFGYLSRRYGWTSDNVRSMDVVTADGRLIRASEKESADLFWGLRGGGGNFGVVTNIEYDLYPVGPEIVGGGIAWHAESAPEVLAMLKSLTEQAPPELAIVGVLRIAPPAPWIDKSAHGKPIVAMFVCHSGAPAEAEKFLAPVKAFGKPVGDILQRRPYVSQQSLLDATQPKGRRYYWKSEYLPRLSTEVLEAGMTHWKKIVSPHSAVIFFPLGGAVAARASDHSAVGNRDAGYVLNITASWEKPEDDGANVEWARSAWQDMRRFSTGGTYINFLTEEEAGQRIQDAYGKNYARLVAIKSKWDPENVFRMNKNILPV